MNGEMEIRDHEWCDRGFSAWIDGEQVAEANYDTHGWSGIESVEKILRSVAQAVGLSVTDKR